VVVPASKGDIIFALQHSFFGAGHWLLSHIAGVRWTRMNGKTILYRQGGPQSVIA
jgi:hypothetical protein